MDSHRATGVIFIVRLLVLGALVRCTGGLSQERIQEVGAIHESKAVALGIKTRASRGREGVRGGGVPLPEIRHSKIAGQGYAPNSPLYTKQQQQSAQPQQQQSPSGNPEAVSTTMKCVISLTTQFFLVYTALFVLQTLNNLKVLERDREEKNLVNVAETLFFVPMLCILFLAAHLRALQLSQGRLSQYNLPPWWVKAAMQTCSWSMLALTLLTLISGAIWGELWEATAKRQGLGSIGKVVINCKNLLLLGIYGGFTLVCIGVCLMHPPEAIWGVDGGPRVSAAVASTIFLSINFFSVHLASACARTANEVGLLGQSLRFGHAQELLKNATVTVAFSPMLCVLFITVRMRALQLDPTNGNPQFWVQVCFYICAASVFAQTLLSIAGAFLGSAPDGTSDTDRPKRLDTKERLIEGARLVAIACLYVAIVAVVVGLYLMELPSRTGPPPQMLPAVRCIVCLTTLYFGVYLSLWAIDTAQRCRPSPPGSQQKSMISVLRFFLWVRAREAVSFCPMFCILFLGTMMRAQQIGGVRGAPQSWCVMLETIATWAILFLTVARVDAVVPGASRRLALFCTVLQYICLFLLYVAAISVVAALFLMTPENMQVVGFWK